MQVCTSLQTDNHANTPPLVFLQAGCPSCRPTNSVKVLKAQTHDVGANSHRHDRHDTDTTVLSCLVWRCELSRPDECVQRRSVSGGAGTAGATAGRTPTQNALVGRSGRLDSHHPTRQRQERLVVSGWRCELGISVGGRGSSVIGNTNEVYNRRRLGSGWYWHR